MPRAKFAATTTKQTPPMAMPRNGKTVRDFLESEEIKGAMFSHSLEVREMPFAKQDARQYHRMHSEELDLENSMFKQSFPINTTNARIVEATEPPENYVMIKLHVTNKFWIQTDFPNKPTPDNELGSINFTMLAMEQVPSGVPLAVKMFKIMCGGDEEIADNPAESDDETSVSSSADSSDNEEEEEDPRENKTSRRLCGGVLTDDGRVVLECGSRLGYAKNEGKMENMVNVGDVAPKKKGSSTLSFSQLRARQTADGKVIFESVILVEASYQLTKTVLFVLPMSQNSLEKKGSKVVQKVIDHGANTTVDLLEKIYLKWLESN